MNTFLPYTDFAESARVLDYRRLGKERVEVLQILRTLHKGPQICTECGDSFSYGCCGGYGKPKTTPWYYHPAVQMWRGYTGILTEYGIIICKEWIDRGYKDTCLEKIFKYTMFKDPTKPWWIGYEDFHRSHRSNLLRKFPKHYRKFWPDNSDNLPYFWPVQKRTVSI